MLVKTNEKDKNGRDIYLRKKSNGSSTALIGNRAVMVPNTMSETDLVVLERGRSRSMAKLPSSVFGTFRKTMQQQRWEADVKRFLYLQKIG